MAFTCNSCGLEFPLVESQRAHMKSDWHRYNLKRRVAQLPPIDEDLFNLKVASLTLEEEKPVSKKEARRREKEAIIEKKRQILETARKAMVAKMEAEAREGRFGLTGDEPAEEAVPEKSAEQLQEELIKEKESNRVDIAPTTCLFCHRKKHADHDSIDDNVEHMKKAHGLYIPEAKYLVDLEGLLKYLGEKIGFGNVCLVCSYQGANLEAVREHMLSKRHMRIPYESEDEKLEISEFYDFSSTYEPEIEGDEGDWEDVSGEEDDDDLPVGESIYKDGTDLILPSGVVLGHRSLQRYYRQKFAPERILSEGQGTVIAAETRHFMSAVDRQHLASQKRAWLRAKKREDVNDRRAAKFVNNQPHFRDPLLQ